MKKKKNYNLPPPDIPGEITKIIGSGGNAKNSLLYSIVKWILEIAVGMVILVVITKIAFKVDIVEDLKAVWVIFIPVITHALAYAFGASQDR